MPLQSTNPVATFTTDDGNELPSMRSIYMYISIFFPAILFLMCSCWIIYRLCFPQCCQCKRTSSSRPTTQHRSTSTNVFTTDGSANVSASGVGQNNTAAIFDDLPPTYNDVILTSNSPTMIIDAEGLPRYETFLVATQSSPLNVGSDVHETRTRTRTSLNNSKQSNVQQSIT